MPAHRIVFAPGASNREVAHEDAAWVGSILRLIDDRARLLIWGRGDRVNRVIERAAALNQPDTLCVAERRLKMRVDESALFAIADVALFIGADVQTADAIARCQALNLPIVAVAQPTVLRVLKGGADAIIVPTFKPPAVAEAVLRLLELRS